MIAKNVWTRKFNQHLAELKAKATHDFEAYVTDFYESELSTDQGTDAKRLATASFILANSATLPIQSKKLAQFAKDADVLLGELYLERYLGKANSPTAVFNVALAEYYSTTGEHERAYELASEHRDAATDEKIAKLANRIGDVQFALENLRPASVEFTRAQFLLRKLGSQNNNPQNWLQLLANLQEHGEAKVVESINSDWTNVDLNLSRGYLLMNALNKKPSLYKLVKPSTILARASHPRQTRLFIRIAAAIENFEANADSHSTIRLQESLREARKLEFIEDEMLVYLSASASFLRQGRLSPRESQLRKYRNLCLISSGGITDDTFALATVTAAPTRKANRFNSYLRIGKTISDIFIEMSLSRLNKLIRNRRLSQEIENQSKARIAKILGDYLSNSRGVLGRFAQLGAIVEVNLPYAIKDELESNFYDSPTMQFADVKALIERETKKPIDQTFSKIDEIAIGAGKLSQVHRATTISGKDVAVKVKFNNIEREIIDDFKLIKKLVGVFKAIEPIHDYKQIFDTWEEILLSEIDFRAEIENHRTISKYLQLVEGAIVPKLHEPLCTANMVVMDFIDGMNFQDFCAEGSQIQKNRAGEIIFESSMRLVHAGFTKYDYHPGNYLFANDQVVFIDFGSLAPAKSCWDGFMAIAGDDFESFKKSTIEQGWAIDPDSFDFQKHFEHEKKFAGRPYLAKDKFKFTKEFVRKYFEYQAIHSPNVKNQTLTRKNVHLITISWMLYSTLGRLEAEACFREIFLKIAKESTAA